MTDAFSNLLPTVILDAVESVSGNILTGQLRVLNSYINRVFELETEEGVSLIAKFYRPGRWSRSALLEEHEFIKDCHNADIPVVAPIEFEGNHTLAEVNGISFALYPKKSGRLFEPVTDEDWIRLGTLVGRLHSRSSQHIFNNRQNCHPLVSTRNQLDTIHKAGVVPAEIEETFFKLCLEIIQRITSLFENLDMHRIHGDCHGGNILHRPEEGLFLIDFDDVMNGPAIQDLWLLLPDYPEKCRKELALLKEGYSRFHEFPDSSLSLIEALRFMRYIYFLSWMVFQHNDEGFHQSFPHWGQDVFWKNEMTDLSIQYKRIESLIS